MAMNNRLGMRLAKEAQKFQEVENMNLQIVDDTANIWHITF